jgi:hypothetical protein
LSELEKYSRAVREAGFEPFETISEPWGLYALKDGSYLRMRANIIKIARTTDDLGNMSFNANINVTVGIIPSRKLRGPPSMKPPTPQDLQAAVVEDDVGLTTVQDDWQSYRLEDGTVLSLKLIPVNVSRTSLFDPNGEPIYDVRHQLLLKASLPEALRRKGIRVQQPPIGRNPTFIT